MSEGPPEERERTRRGLWRAFDTLRIPHFAPLFGANFVQLFCGQILMIAMQWLVITQLTESRTLYMIIGFLQGGVVAVLSPIAGVVADRVSKRALLIAGRLGLVAIVAVMATLVASEAVRLIHVYVASVLAGVISAAIQPAGQAFVFDVVGRERVENAISLNATGSGLAQVLGPAVAAGLLAAIGVAGSFYTAGAAMLGSVGLLLAIPIAGRAVARAAERTPLQDLRDGFGWVRGDAPVRLVLLACTMALFNGALAPMRPVFAHYVLDVGERGLGAMGVAAGLGTVLAALALTSLASFRRPGFWIVGSLWAYALCMLLYAFAFSFEYVLAIEFLAGIAGQVWNVTVMAGLQLAVPERMRGRVIGMVFMVAQLGFLGQPLIGLLADRFGDQVALGLFGIVPSVVLAGVLLFGATTLGRVGDAGRRSDR